MTRAAKLLILTTTALTLALPAEALAKGSSSSGGARPTASAPAPRVAAPAPAPRVAATAPAPAPRSNAPAAAASPSSSTRPAAAVPAAAVPAAAAPRVAAPAPAAAQPPARVIAPPPSASAYAETARAIFAGRQNAEAAANARIQSLAAARLAAPTAPASAAPSSPNGIRLLDRSGQRTGDNASGSFSLATVQGTERDANGLSVARDSFGQVRGELMRNRFQPGDVQAGAAASATALSAQVDRTAANGRSTAGAGARLLNAEANYGVDYERRPGHLGVKAGGGIGADLASVEARGSRSFNLGRRELKVEGNAGAGIGIGANAGGEYLREKDRGAVGFNVGGAFGPGVDIGGRVSWQPIGG